MKSKNNYGGWYFLTGTAALLVLTWLRSPGNAITALIMFKDIIIRVIPIFILIFILMAAADYFVSPIKLIKYLGRESGIKGWLLAVTAGILSSGPIYIWYPLLSDLQKKGMSPGLISAFLYNRAVKIPLIPLLIAYFGLAYSVILLLVMVVVSVFQGKLTEIILKGFKED